MNKTLRIILFPFRVIYLVIMGIVYTLIVSLPKNLKLAGTYSFNKSKRDEINRKVKQDKMIKLLKEKIERLERLVYATIKDSDYFKSDKGKIDVKELKKEARK
ncbi:hypothetical protein K8R47_03925 [archaeon]|nr:hypothetical protein [archaeon]